MEGRKEKGRDGGREPQMKGEREREEIKTMDVPSLPLS
jgi:hypothetical protein